MQGIEQEMCKHVGHELRDCLRVAELKLTPPSKQRDDTKQQSAHDVIEQQQQPRRDVTQPHTRKGEYRRRSVNEGKTVCRMDVNLLFVHNIIKLAYCGTKQLQNM